MARGTRTVKKMGVLQLITNTIVTNPEKVANQILVDDGIVISTTSMSLENRFIIRPRGVVSKKDIGAWSIDFSSRLCKRFEAFIFPKAKANDCPNIANAEIRHNATNITENINFVS